MHGTGGITFLGCVLRRVITEQGGIPVAFDWNGKTYSVQSILKQWHDYDHSPLSPKRDWRSRRHRNYFQVRTESGECFELYCDRGTKLGAMKRWVLRASIAS
jgi:poly(3-hydroxybutyrate) depolymerase